MFLSIIQCWNFRTIPASSYSVKSEVRQMKQCWINCIKKINNKTPPVMSDCQTMRASTKPSKNEEVFDALRFWISINKYEGLASSKDQCWNFRTIYGARNRLGIGLSYRPDRLHRLAESIPGLLKNLNIRALACSFGPNFFLKNIFKNYPYLVQ
jgi:hypothetical protein